MKKIRAILHILIIFLISGCASISSDISTSDVSTAKTSEFLSTVSLTTEQSPTSIVQSTTGDITTAPTTTPTTAPTTTPTTTPTTHPILTYAPSTIGATSSNTTFSTETTLTTEASPITLQPPVGIYMESGILYWSEVDLSAGYLVLLDDQEIAVNETALLLEDLAVGDHLIQIKALGDQVLSLDSDFSDHFIVSIALPDPLPLDCPSQLVINGSLLSWDPVAGAIDYVIQFNEDPEIVVVTNSFDFGPLIPGTYRIEIVARGDQITTLNSPASTIEHIIHATQLSTVTELRIVEQMILWDNVEFAQSYLIDINGEFVSSTTNSLELDQSTPGDYLISIKAVGDQLFYLDSEWSDTTTYTLTAPNLFITAKGDQLYLGEDNFRFVSFNVPNYLVLEDPTWHRVDPWEQEDAIQSIKRMGGRVIRTYTLSIIGGVRPKETGNQLAHILGEGVYSEALFVDLDKAIQLAGEHGVYLIIPLIDEWSWVGGITEFSALYGKTKSQFFTDAEVKQGFKNLIAYVLNRTNTFTGVKYKDDPAILAWELGNELRSATDLWIAEMATYVKSIDSNHLLMSGRDKITTADLNNPNIDIVSSHYYTNNGVGSFADRAKADRALSVGKKPFIIGEYGLVDVQQIEDMIVESVNNGSSGSLIWSLRFRNVNGGFYYHNDFPSRSYHYPGFAINDDYFETRIINFIIEHAYLVSGEGEYTPVTPEAPVLFLINNAELTWRGATGSAYFSVERRQTGDLEWQELTNHASDAMISGPFFIDPTVEEGISYDYRIRAHNQAGYSEYSNVVVYTHLGS